jgi:hypothetical protein
MKPYRYVAGFLFDSALHNVLLIEKQKPEWQVGMLNAIGGKIEGDELPMDAKCRFSCWSGRCGCFVTTATSRRWTRCTAN